MVYIASDAHKSLPGVSYHELSDILILLERVRVLKQLLKGGVPLFKDAWCDVSATNLSTNEYFRVFALGGQVKLKIKTSLNSFLCRNTLTASQQSAMQRAEASIMKHFDLMMLKISCHRRSVYEDDGNQAVKGFWSIGSENAMLLSSGRWLHEQARADFRPKLRDDCVGVLLFKITSIADFDSEGVAKACDVIVIDPSGNLLVSYREDTPDRQMLPSGWQFKQASSKVAIAIFERLRAGVLSSVFIKSILVHLSGSQKMALYNDFKLQSAGYFNSRLSSTENEVFLKACLTHLDLTQQLDFMIRLLNDVHNALLPGQNTKLTESVDKLMTAFRQLYNLPRSSGLIVENRGDHRTSRCATVKTSIYRCKLSAILETFASYGVKYTEPESGEYHAVSVDAFLHVAWGGHGAIVVDTCRHLAEKGDNRTDEEDSLFEHLHSGLECFEQTHLMNALETLANELFELLPKSLGAGKKSSFFGSSAPAAAEASAFRRLVQFYSDPETAPATKNMIVAIVAPVIGAKDAKSIQMFFNSVLENLNKPLEARAAAAHSSLTSTHSAQI